MGVDPPPPPGLPLQPLQLILHLGLHQLLSETSAIHPPQPPWVGEVISERLMRLPSASVPTTPDNHPPRVGGNLGLPNFTSRPPNTSKGPGWARRLGCHDAAAFLAGASGRAFRIQYRPGRPSVE